MLQDRLAGESRSSRLPGPVQTIPLFYTPTLQAGDNQEFPPRHGIVEIVSSR
jgi:hypothetical protein